jgi:L-ascorbate metabolism protein UlaG (beta-lactamase superfamily)
MLQCRWLGVAGVELSAGGQTLVIDPFFTRFPFWRMWPGRVRPDRDLIAATLRRCDHVLVTHAHWDHLMDVPHVALNTGAAVAGSRNTCQLLEVLGVPPGQIRQISAGERLSLGEFQVEVLPAQHGRTPIDRTINGPLRPGLKPPLRAFDYRMDACFSFLVRVGGYRLLIGPGENPVESRPADVLFVGVIKTVPDPPAYYAALLRRVRPAVVIPYHWDDLFSPLSRPLRPTFQLPEWAFPPLRRVDLAAFSRMITHTAPGTRVLVPEIFRVYEVDKLV